MKLLCTIVVLLAFTKNALSFYLTARPEQFPSATIATQTLPLFTETKHLQPTSAIKGESTLSLDEHSSVITIAPLTVNPMMRRQQQRCFNDQGFSVDCATWTGYYYSWGPSGDPYEGGPGEGQGGSGSGSGSNSGGSGVVYQSDSSFFIPDVAAILGFCLLVVAILLD